MTTGRHATGPPPCGHTLLWWGGEGEGAYVCALPAGHLTLHTDGKVTFDNDGIIECSYPRYLLAASVRATDPGRPVVSPVERHPDPVAVTSVVSPRVVRECGVRRYLLAAGRVPGHIHRCASWAEHETHRCDCGQMWEVTE